MRSYHGFGWSISITNWYIFICLSITCWRYGAVGTGLLTSSSVWLWLLNTVAKLPSFLALDLCSVQPFPSLSFILSYQIGQRRLHCNISCFYYMGWLFHGYSAIFLSLSSFICHMTVISSFLWRVQCGDHTISRLPVMHTFYKFPDLEISPMYRVIILTLRLRLALC